MKIEVRSDSPERLRIVMRPSKIVYVTFAVVFALAAVWVLATLGDTVGLEVEDGTLRYERKFLGLVPRDGFALPASEIEAVEVRLGDGLFRSYDLYVDSRGGERHLVRLPSLDGDAKREAASAISAAMSEPGATWQHSASPFLIALLLAVSALAGSLIIVFALQEVLVTGSRDSGVVTIHRKRTLLPRGDIEKISLEDCRGIEITEHRTTTDRGQRLVSYQVQLRRKQGKPIPLAKGPLFTRKSAEEARDRIRDWIEGKNETA